MNPNTTAWNRLRYTLYAPLYDAAARLFGPDRRRAVALVAPRPGERVLILGAGTGLDLEYLPAGCEVTAVDLSPAMIRRLRRRAQRLGRQVEARVMDAERLELADEHYDVVLLHLILAVVPDAEACAREAARVLKPAGRISVFDKFLDDAAQPGPARRLANLFTNALFSDINRRLTPILTQAGLVAESVEPGRFGRLFRLARVRKAALQ